MRVRNTTAYVILLSVLSAVIAKESTAQTTRPSQFDVTAQSIALPKGQGSIQGMGDAFSASESTGTGSFGIPIPLPGSRGSADPALALAYSTAQGNGIAGLGWSAGASSISRELGRGTPGYEDLASGAFHANQDRFVMDGQELVPLGQVVNGKCALAPNEVMPAWAEGWQYFRPRIEGGYVRIFWSRDHRTWRIQDKSGAGVEYGVPLDGSNRTDGLETHPTDSSKIFKWNIVRKYDNQGANGPTAGQATPTPSNVTWYTYSTIGALSYLTDIHYGSRAGSSNAAPATAAFHVRLVYEPRSDVLRSLRRGWETVASQRLKRIDITARGKNVDAPRELLRRVHLGYDAASRQSLLVSVQEEGRCATAVQEGTTGELPNESSCPRMPATLLGYSKPTTGGVSIPGFGSFDTTIQSLTGSPAWQLGSVSADVFDINGDSLPDAVRTGADGVQAHEIRFNGSGGSAGTFGAAVPMAVAPGSPYTAESLRIRDNTVLPMDADANGILDLLRVTTLPTSYVFSPQQDNGRWQWVPRPATTPTDLAGSVDPIITRSVTRTFDVNGDGLVDIVSSLYDGMRTYFNLGNYPGGDGKYGTARWTSATSATIQNTPVRGCSPRGSNAISFAQPGYFTGDINGDGFVDIVRVTTHYFYYWAGNGTGSFGQCNGTDATPTLTLSWPRMLSINSDSEIKIADVNGDGLDDIVRATGITGTVILNQFGTGFSPDWITLRGPSVNANGGTVRIVDINGSGTPDVLWGSSDGWKFVDLQAGTKPNLLTSIRNGLGASTTIEYANSATLMLQSERAGSPWQSKSPTSTWVVRRVTTSDNLPVAGRPANQFIKEYTYRDAVFDSRERAFRGFRQTTVQSTGDADSPPSMTRSTFMTGDCVDETPSDSVAECSNVERWRDNRRAALQGLGTLVESYDENDTYLSTKHNTYTLRHLFTGLDGRAVRHAIASKSEAWIYDTAQETSSGPKISVDDVTLEGVGGTKLSSSITIRGTTGVAHTESSVVIDAFGNTTKQIASGRPGIDEAIESNAVFQLVPGDTGGWLYRPIETWTQGSQHEGRIKDTFFEYDAKGNLLVTRSDLSGTVPLDRFHKSGKAVAPPHERSSKDGRYVVSATDYDVYGNAVFQRMPNNQCRAFVFDPEYATLATSEIIYVNGRNNDPKPGTRSSAAFATEPGGNLCGIIALVASAEYDRVTGQPIRVMTPQGEVSAFEYDGFGRPTKVYRPDPNGIGRPGTLPSTITEYDIDPTGQRAFSRIHTRTQTGNYSNEAAYTDAWAIVDGLGRTVVTLQRADTANGAPGTWVASGLTDYDPQGKPRRVFEPWYTNATPENYPLADAPTTRFSRHVYDGFGRKTASYGLDGQQNTKVVFHALSTDVWDAEDLNPSSPAAGTYATAIQDGHGRESTAVVRYRTPNGTLHTSETQKQYGPGGEVEVIRRSTSEGAAPVVRWSRFDSWGRMVVNAEPNTSVGFTANPKMDLSRLKTWRYAYDVAGHLVGTSDARGCGVNYTYDAAGRVTGEDYSPCEDHHAAYTSGPEVVHIFDVPYAESESVFGGPSASVQGRRTFTKDRAARAMYFYDARGRVSKVAKAPNAPNGTIRSQWFVKEFDFDVADRTTRETAGDRAETSVNPLYGESGRLVAVDSSRGMLVAGIQREADGLVTEVKLGDLAGTTVSTTYDELRRVKTTTAFRARPQAWANATGDALRTQQLVLQDEEFIYDRIGNPIEIRDWRNSSEWPDGSKPVTRRMQYDSLNRVTRVDYQYAGVTGGADKWLDPYEKEHRVGNPSRGFLPIADLTSAGRPQWQSWSFDWLGNIVDTDDHAHAFWDRSLGKQDHSTTAPYQIKSASNTTKTGGRTGTLLASYDASGNTTQIRITKAGPCIPAGSCAFHQYNYYWDEVGNLSRAKRFAASTETPDTTPSQLNMDFAYDSTGQRVRKSAWASHSIYVFPSLELRNTAFNNTQQAYDVTNDSEVTYLVANGVKLARVGFAKAPDGLRTSRVFLELGDTLGSTAVVLDHATGELVERTTAFAYGATESDYRPDRWDGYREPYKFTGKEEDAELGITYFGKRFYSPFLGRWLSADPLAIHAPGQADLNLYAYVHGRVFVAVDPLGLDKVLKARPMQIAAAFAYGAPSMASSPMPPKVNQCAMQSPALAVTPAPAATTPAQAAMTTTALPGVPNAARGYSAVKQLDPESYHQQGQQLAITAVTLPIMASRPASLLVGAGILAATAENHDSPGVYVGLSFMTPGLKALGTSPSATLNQAGSLLLRLHQNEYGGLSLPFAGRSVVAQDSTTAIQLYWPPNQGFLGMPKPATLQPGTLIDRFGGSDVSRFFSPAGTPLGARAMPPETAALSLRTFEVLQPLSVEQGTVAPAFGQLGFGTQYRTSLTLGELLDQRVIREVAK